jgi:hypothetical protein
MTTMINVTKSFEFCHVTGKWKVILSQKEGSTDIFYNIDDSLRNYVECKNPETKSHICHQSPFI